jgi:hypothetical protein
MQDHGCAITKLNERPEVRCGASVMKVGTITPKTAGTSRWIQIWSGRLFLAQSIEPSSLPLTHGASLPNAGSHFAGLRANTLGSGLARSVWKPHDSDGQEYKCVNESLFIASACVRDDDMESVDDQIQASWPGSNSVSGDRNAGSCRGRNRDPTLVRTGRSPPTARRRYSPIRISADS